MATAKKLRYTLCHSYLHLLVFKILFFYKCLQILNLCKWISGDIPTHILLTILLFIDSYQRETIYQKFPNVWKIG